MCTLAICKPVIRRTARVGDWVVGTGSKNSPIGDVSGCLVYAMKVTASMSMADCDAWTAQQLPAKVPSSSRSDNRRRLGDSIYDFSVDPPSQRDGVHGPENVHTDLGGLNVLLSSHFYYFGDRPLLLPKSLLPIVKQGQGHRSWSNQPYITDFVAWLEESQAPGIHGQPQLDLFQDETTAKSCALLRAQESIEDETLGEEPAPTGPLVR